MNSTKVTYLVDPIPVLDEMIKENGFRSFVDQLCDGWDLLKMGQYSYKGRTFIVGTKIDFTGNPHYRYVYKVHKEL